MKLAVGSDIETNCNLPSSMFKIAASPITFELLSTKLYSDPDLAMIRELLTNAYDSHVAAGTTDIPIDVHFPTWEEDFFSIRDYGTGLSKEDVFDLYTVFFKSSKSSSNDFTGCFGLGSKTPFSCVSSFSVISFYNGTAYHFICMKQNGLPHVTLIKEENTEEPNGLKITLSGLKSKTLIEKTTEYLRFIPEIKINSNTDIVPVECIRLLDNVYLYGKDPLRECNLYIKQGQNTFKILTSEYSSANAINELLRHLTLVIEVPIGTYEVTPSRESLIDSPKIQQDIWYTLIQIEGCLKDFFSQIRELAPNTFVDLINYYYYSNEESFLKVSSSRVNPHDMYLYFTKRYTSRDMSIEHFLSSNTDFNSTYNCVALEDRETVILLGYNKEVKNNLGKVRKILEQHNLLARKDYCLVVINQSNAKGKGILYEYVLKKFLRELFKSSKLPYVTFKVKPMFLYEFLEKYPIQKEQRVRTKTGKVVNADKSILYHSLTVDCKKAKVFHKERERLALKEVLKAYNPNNTIVLEDNESNFSSTKYPYSIYRCYGLFPSLLSSLFCICDKEGNYFLRDFLWERYSRNFTKVSLLFVKKSNLQLFKEYLHITEEDVYNLLATHDTQVGVYGLFRDRLKHTKESLSSFCGYNQLNLKGKQKTLFMKSKLYQKMRRLLSITERHLRNSVMPVYLEEQLTEFLKNTPLKDKAFTLTEKQKEVLMKYLLNPPLLKELETIYFESTPKSYLKRFNFYGVPYKVGEPYKQLPEKGKHELLRLIRKYG